jgi:preprotein translocase subunit SecA
MQRLGMEEGVPIEHGMVTRAIERAQKQVEAQNFSVRKHLLEYDDVMNKQRESVYALRRELLEGKIRLDEEQVVESREYVMTLAEDLLDGIMDTYAGQDTDAEEWDPDGLRQAAAESFGLDASDFAGLSFERQSSGELRDALWARIQARYEEKERILEPAILRRVERDIMLQIVDAQWKDHLYSLDHLKEGIGLRGYGQRDPLVEYKKESFELFQAMKDRIDEEIVRYLWRLRPIVQDEMPPVRRPQPRRPTSLTYNDPTEAALPAMAGAARAAPGGAFGEAPRPARTGGDDAAIRTVKRDVPKVGRNDLCPCGSGKKYKKCHGA